MKIIINADDFGIDKDRDIGIYRAVKKGYITSVSVVVTNEIGKFHKKLINRIRKKTSVGIHINLTDNPLLKYSMEDLCEKIYNYPKPKHNFWLNSINNTIHIDKIKEEIFSQLQKFYESFSFMPEHIDGHNHCNIFNSQIEKIFEEIAERNKIHLRIPYEDLNTFDKNDIENNNYFEDFEINKETNLDLIKNNFDYYLKYDMLLNNYMCEHNCKGDDVVFVGTMYGYFREPQILLKQLLHHQKDVVQVMTHPGFYFKRIKHNSPFSNKDRVKEYQSLKSVKKSLSALNCQYVTYKTIQANDLEHKNKIHK